ncbi:MAG: hypothetical protein HKN84_02895, partial [Gammaproteobacteria bacterium]|nr:hypothetical protein [Gammaproteobacteria bacterium]
MVAYTGDPVWRSGPGHARVAVIAALALESRIVTATLRPPATTVFVSGPGGSRAAASARTAID